MNTKAAGDRGEAEVAKYLRKKGYALLASQWRCRFGELDLVARDRKGTVCFVEVKLRSAYSIGLPREFVDRRKQERLRSAAAAYLSTYELDAPARFDVAEVYADSGGALRVEYIEDAFQ
ncbi:YraN family protein [uncultured Dysosmobacter sp.]|uniref:YraN family protein n=1 Tax=uncultured Dysosmobacter sp. TaxID=2591384 RepID=UPI00262F947B|nr:YraN family protein [uncultured Dysosmobacter sp.]